MLMFAVVQWYGPCSHYSVVHPLVAPFDCPILPVRHLFGVPKGCARLDQTTILQYYL